ncbi:MAG: glycoside hydrolase family 3 C-terminal domain-containing protein [Ignavibacteriales bacterium]|nr:glycoside hydrolase family 3 C-terminal domain-containing protein [Ignavibacteriales bacterium]
MWRKKYSLALIVTLSALFIHDNSSAQIYLDSTASIQTRVEDLLNQMTTDEKIGQMLQLERGSVENNLSRLSTFPVGSILSGGGSVPNAGNTPLKWANMYDSLQTYALKSRLKIPIIYGIDAVHGNNNVYSATIFPHNIGMGCTRNPELAKQAAQVTATEVRATGLNWTFGPCIAVPRDIRWGRTYEGFGETPELAQMFAASEVSGFQGDTLNGPTSILACAKHFLGDGGTIFGTSSSALLDQGNTILSESSVRLIHLPGYISAVNAGVGSVMVSFSSINGLKMHGNKYWITDVLKNELGFKGFVVSDWRGIDQLNNDYKTCLEQSVNAGIDMIMIPQTTAAADMQSLVSSGKISLGRIDDAVRRILTEKFKLGLFEHPFANRSLLTQVGSSANRAVARQCVRESMVLLKKKDGILPLRKTNARILVAGSNADDLGNQCGGWTIDWQGQSGNITNGTTILAGLKKIAPGTQIDYSATGVFTNTKADYSLVVIGERPYAEMYGDAFDLRLSANDIALVKKMKGYGAPVILILVSGRPLIIEDVLHYSDVIVAAWLPGTEGDGIAEVLFGDYQPKGLLSHTWPKNMSQIPINYGDPSYTPRYAYGFGIQNFTDSPSGSAPVCLSVLLTSNPHFLELTFNKQMSAPSAFNGTFSVTQNNTTLPSSHKVSLKTGDSTTFIVQIDSIQIQRSDICTISYTGGDLQSSDGGVLQSFNSLEVINGATPTSIAIPAKIMVDNYFDMNNIFIYPLGDGDSNDSFIFGPQAMAEYFVNVPTAGTYYLTFRIMSFESSSIQISYGTQNLSVPISTTNNWTTTNSIALTLPAGEQKIKVKIPSYNVLLHWINFNTEPTSVNNGKTTPFTARLYQNFPNPFNPTTTIGYEIPAKGQVTLKVFDMLGREVSMLVDEIKPAGEYKVTWDASMLPSGVYLIQVQAGNYFSVKKAILLK